MSLRDVGFFVRGRISQAVSRLANARHPTPRRTPAPLESMLGTSGPPIALVPLLEARSNAEREDAVARHLAARGVPFARHRFKSFEGRGENFTVEIGSGDRVLVLIAHHDAVPVSPGANDNAASVAILLQLMDRIATSVPPGLRVRLIFTAAEELGYLGARAYVAQHSLDGIAGVLSLELCGIGDSIALWDVDADSPFLARIRGALEGIGRRNDESYHVVGRIPVFGSDHRAFQPSIPAYGLTVVPTREADALRQFVFNPVRSALVHLVHRPPPFDTYHTSRDSADTLDAKALDAMVVVLEAIISELGS